MKGNEKRQAYTCFMRPGMIPCKITKKQGNPNPNPSKNIHLLQFTFSKSLQLECQVMESVTTPALLLLLRPLKKGMRTFQTILEIESKLLGIKLPSWTKFYTSVGTSIVILAALNQFHCSLTHTTHETNNLQP